MTTPATTSKGRAMSSTGHRRRLLAALAGATSLATAACSGIQTGTVTDKYISPPYTYFIQTGGICSGNPPTCSPVVMVPISVPQRWVLTLEDCTGGTGRANEECETGRVEVDPGTYDATSVGDFYEDPDGDG